jgi:hypothetical protein
MHPLVLINRKPPAPNWEKRFFWSNYTERELCKAIRLASGREMRGRYKGNSFFWRSVRKRLVTHYQSLYGEVPLSFNRNRLSNIMEIASTIEYQQWVRREK